ncbi:FAD-dependent oxidoreductase [Fluviispira multicolorata]|uniref:FAD-dependent oxidoreductase n=1 Tax=Fluviispira multicolorata TaxID=2654512 RepID=A0A833N2Q8_9BACT|nr:FAD-dependent oxidoreductase [Fluviispira multicolorata]KAB8028546.1 FAD-dependent oxidoreductase [Fluviispira multicolorata]
MSDYQFDVAIVGSGPFACFTALLLAEQNMSVGLITPEHSQPLDSFLNSLSACWPTLNDPPTRADVAHGHDVALYLNDFCTQGVHFFKNKFLPLINDSNNWIESKCLRIGLKDFEKEELLVAEKLGFSLIKTPEDGVYLDSTNSILCKDKKIFQDNFIQTLEKNKVQIIQSSAIGLKETQSKCFIDLNNKNKIECEVVVLANGLDIAKLIQRFEKYLIPMSDCLYEYESNRGSDTPPMRPLSFRASNGHICGTFIQNNKNLFLRISGPRFLLPGAGAGINLTQTKIEDKTFKSIEKFHKEIIFPIFAKELGFSSSEEFLNKFEFKITTKKILADCYPCDELPLLGEFGKLGKVLGNTGWLATGFPAGAWAAKIICDLILNEKSSHLLPRLRPRRLQSAFIKKHEDL